MQFSLKLQMLTHDTNNADDYNRAIGRALLKAYHYMHGFKNYALYHKKDPSAMALMQFCKYIIFNSKIHLYDL